jgi:hypothetical protein
VRRLSHDILLWVSRSGSKTGIFPRGLAVMMLPAAER